MKIYVDKLPKNCGECSFNYGSVGCEVFETKTGKDGEELRRCLDAMYGDFVKDAITDRRFSKCPLATTQSLKQQVREEMVEEIKEKFNDTIKHHFCPNPSSVDFITLCISEVEEFLDQVKGVNNVKD